MKKILLFLIIFLLPGIVNAGLYIEDFQVPLKLGIMQNETLTRPFLTSYFEDTNAEMSGYLPRPYYRWQSPTKEFYFLMNLNSSLLEDKYYLVSIVYAFNGPEGFLGYNFDDYVTNTQGNKSHFYKHTAYENTFFEWLYNGNQNTSSYRRVNVSITSFLIKTTDYANVLKFKMSKNTAGTSFSFYGYQITYAGGGNESIDSVNSKVDKIISSQLTTNSKIDTLSGDMKQEFKFANDLSKANSQNEINAANANSKAEINAANNNSKSEISAANTNSQNEINAANSNSKKEIEAMNKNQEQANKNSQNEVNATNKNTDAVNNQTNAMTNSNVDVDGSFFSGFDNNTHGLTAIITSPLQLIGSITSSKCSPLGLPMPFGMPSVTLPCMSEIYSTYFGAFFNLYQTITFGMISYWVCVQIFAIVKGMKDPDSDRIEVLDL